MSQKVFSLYLSFYLFIESLQTLTLSLLIEWEKRCRKLPFSAVFIRKGTTGCNFHPVLFAACCNLCLAWGNDGGEKLLTLFPLPPPTPVKHKLVYPNNFNIN